MEQTFVMIKPDGVQRALVGEIISRIEKKGFKLKAMKLMRITPELARKHYAEHEGKAFFNDLVEFITSGPNHSISFPPRAPIKTFLRQKIIIQIHF
jgi:nucleoside-diphosphate kinase